MNNVITLTDEQMADLRAGEPITIKPPKRQLWEPRGGRYSVGSNAQIVEYRSKNEYRLDGSERETLEAAERAAKLITRYKRLLAYVDEHRREGEKDNCTVYFVDGAWCIDFSSCSAHLGAVFMPARVAKQLVADLESGVYFL